MKPAPFQYHAPTTLDEALSLLNEHGYDAKILAGGQSLIPTMNFRLAQPAVLIDLNHVPKLFYINESADGGLRLGAMTRQSQVERSQLVAQRAPLLHESMALIAHPQIRNRGTIGGSIAHADPAAELPVLAVALGAQLRVQSSTGERIIPARDFYMGLFTTALEPEEILTEIHIPALPPRSGWAMDEVARRHGDYAIVGAAATLSLAEDGTCQQAKLVFLSVGEGPVSAEQAEQMLIGESPTPERIADSAQIAATQEIDPAADIHASVAYRRHLAEVLAKRVLSKAVDRANQHPAM